MRRSQAFAAALLIPLLAVGCSGNPEPEPVEPAAQPAPPPPPPVDDTAEREAAADRLCARAEAAMEAGDFQTAADILRQVLREYPGTECAALAPDRIARAEAAAAITARIHFDFDLAEITDQAAAVLRDKAEALRQYPDVMLTIEGHCDERGSAEYNLALGMRRAQAAIAYLVSLGLDDGRFRPVTYGEERPIGGGSNESAWGLDRRGEFVITAGDL
ncbi:MAG: OmpA family protein [Gemmatimonadota bacterium]|nr:OmpA family protein [Gemmatimonadota bacterium]